VLNAKVGGAEILRFRKFSLMTCSLEIGESPGSATERSQRDVLTKWGTATQLQSARGRSKTPQAGRLGQPAYRADCDKR
jgi:hypothetical protein